ncbi:MAG TPA: hypothetical protein VGB22_10745 [candidate division Zixibacteria bacterium]|jgi:hypothetical protein
MKRFRPYALVIMAGLIAILPGETAPTARDNHTELRRDRPNPAATPIPNADVSPEAVSTPGQPGTTAEIADTTLSAPVQSEPELAGPVPATVESAGSYSIPWRSINGGGRPIASSGFSINASVGQSAIGLVSSSGYEAGIGYWYGVRADFSGACGCACHADPVCDGVTNVFDVVSAVDVAFRNGMATSDGDCPADRQEVNCDGVVNVFDVVILVDVAFRNGSTTQYCDPCQCTPYPGGCP